MLFGAHPIQPIETHVMSGDITWVGDVRLQAKDYVKQMG